MLTVEDRTGSAMLSTHILLVLTTCTSVGTAILEKVGDADLNAVRIRLEDEKAKRLLLENDVEVLMMKVEELKREILQMSTDTKATLRNVSSHMDSIAFTAILSRDTTLVSEQTVIFDNVKLNDGNCYDASTGRFRAPFKGLYMFSVTALKNTLNTAVHLFIMKENVEIGRVISGYSSYDSGSVTVVTVLEKGQVAYVKERPDHNYTETMHGDNWAHFTGVLLVRHN